MRIALVAPPWLPVPPLGYGGTERVVSLLADGLVERGHDVTLFAAAGSRSRARVVVPLAEPPACINANLEDAAYQSLVATAAADGFDLVHDHTLLGPAFAAARRSGPPVVHTAHGRWTAATRRLLGAVADRVHVVAISRAQRQSDPSIGCVGVVHNGIDLDAHPFRRQKEDFLVFLGRVHPEKGPEVAIDVARKSGLPLTMMVKREDPEEWEYWEHVVQPRLADDVHVIEQPPHAVKVALLGRARAVLCPIDWPEPFGLVFAEAAACGTPVVTRPIGAAPEIVVPDRTGFLCQDTSEMADAVASAGSIDPQDCRDHVATRFSAAAMVRGYEQVYASVLRGHARAAAPRDAAAPEAGA